jgi:hypothetical protein
MEAGEFNRKRANHGGDSGIQRAREAQKREGGWGGTCTYLFAPKALCCVVQGVLLARHTSQTTKTRQHREGEGIGSGKEREGERRGK